MNVQLVIVVVEAGLSVLTRDDPFAQWDVLLPQAVDSISVVKATITRQPEVLLSPTTADGPQLLLWLLARLLAVCAMPKCSELPISELINSMIASLERSAKLWKTSLVVRGLLQDCANGMWSLPTVSKYSAHFVCRNFSGHLTRHESSISLKPTNAEMDS